jgi:hypothetical protein
MKESPLPLPSLIDVLINFGAFTISFEMTGSIQVTGYEKCTWQHHQWLASGGGL